MPKDALDKNLEEISIKVAEDQGLIEKIEEKPKEVKSAEKQGQTEETRQTDKEVSKPPELTQEQLAAATTLYNALNNPDPNIQRQAVKILATAAGLDAREIETKKEVQEAKATFLDLLKSGLGEYDFLAEKFAPVLEDLITKKVEEQTKARFDRFEQSNRIEKEINSAIDNAFAKYENAHELKNEVLALMDTIKPTDKSTHEQYFGRLITIAAAEKGITLTNKGQTKSTPIQDKEKIAKSRSDAHSRLASERGAEVKDSVRAPNQRRGLTSAIEDAIESLASEGGRRPA